MEPTSGEKRQVLYHAVSSYQLLEAVLHRLRFHPHDPAVLLLPNFLGMLGVQLSQPIADVFSFLLAVPLALSELKDMKRLEEQLRIAPQADEM